MKPLVLDASAALKLVLADEESAQVSALVEERLAAGIVVPSLFWLEIINVLARRHGYPGSVVLEAVHGLESLGIRTVDADAASVLAVIDLVERHDLSAYDAAYLGLAISLEADLATADRRLAVSAGERALVIGPDAGIAEERATYRPRPATWPSWPDAGAYLAQLRAALA